MINHGDTIVAIATALSPSGIGVIRVSGNETKKIISSIFVDKNKSKINIEESHKVRYGYIYDDVNDIILDEVIILTMYKPRSYTAEDVIEVQCHGGMIVVKKILDLIVSKGARIAEPGEFTKRAFLNGRIDLSKAESVTDIIMSKNEYAYRASFEQLKGNLSDKLNAFRNEILESTAFIEACLDDPEHMSVDGYKEELKTKVENIIDEFNTIIKNYDNGKLIREGVNTVILGKPNVGKSSLLNLLLDEERAIVTDVAGTTRDVIKESINLNGITLNIIDTAGIRNAAEVDEVEKIGIEKAKNEAEKADLIILVIDAADLSTSGENNKSSFELINVCKKQKKKYIVLLNKYDLLDEKNIEVIDKIKEEIKKPSILVSNEDISECGGVINFSTKTRQGFDELKKVLEKMFISGELDFNNEIFISNERQLSSIIKARESLKNVLTSIEKEMPEDLLTIDLTDAYTHLSQVLGIEINDDVVNEIFSKFCMGK